MQPSHIEVTALALLAAVIGGLTARLWLVRRQRDRARRSELRGWSAHHSAQLEASAARHEVARLNRKIGRMQQEMDKVIEGAIGVVKLGSLDSLREAAADSDWADLPP